MPVTIKIEKCQDCGNPYNPTSGFLPPHAEICPARTCQGCWETFEYPIPANKEGKRICLGCQPPPKV